MNRRFIPSLLRILFSGCIFFNQALAASSPEQSSPVTDPRQVADHYRQIVNEPEYRESDDSDATDQVKDWLTQLLSRLNSEFGQFTHSFAFERQMPRFASLLMTVFIILSLIGLIYILRRLTRFGGAWDPPLPADETTKNIFRAPEFYAEELRLAVAKKDWRGAWQASWRQLLSRLERGRLVEADRSRTNREYLAQLRSQPLPDPAVNLLKSMVDAYDKSIYGCKDIGEPEWTSFQHQADEATLLLHLQDGAPTEAKTIAS